MRFRWVMPALATFRRKMGPFDRPWPFHLAKGQGGSGGLPELLRRGEPGATPSIRHEPPPALCQC
jgi:hypothetical protein